MADKKKIINGVEFTIYWSCNDNARKPCFRCKYLIPNRCVNCPRCKEVLKHKIPFLKETDWINGQDTENGTNVPAVPVLPVNIVETIINYIEVLDNKTDDNQVAYVTGSDTENGTNVPAVPVLPVNIVETIINYIEVLDNKTDDNQVAYVTGSDTENGTNVPAVPVLPVNIVETIIDYIEVLDNNTDDNQVAYVTGSDTEIESTDTVVTFTDSGTDTESDSITDNGLNTDSTYSDKSNLKDIYHRLVTETYAHSLRKMFDYKSYCNLIKNIGDNFNGRMERFEKAKIIELGIESYSSGKLKRVDLEGRDHVDTLFDLDIEFKYATDSLYTKGKKKTRKL